MNQCSPIVNGLTFCCYPGDQTKGSIGLRITVLVISIIAISVALCALFGVPGLKQIGTAFGWTLFSVGTLLMLAGAIVKRIKEESTSTVVINNGKSVIQELVEKKKLEWGENKKNLNFGNIPTPLHLGALLHYIDDESLHRMAQTNSYFADLVERHCESLCKDKIHSMVPRTSSSWSKQYIETRAQVYGRDAWARLGVKIVGDVPPFPSIDLQQDHPLFPGESLQKRSKFLFIPDKIMFKGKQESLTLSTFKNIMENQPENARKVCLTFESFIERDFGNSLMPSGWIEITDVIPDSIGKNYHGKSAFRKEYHLPKVHETLIYASLVYFEKGNHITDTISKKAYYEPQCESLKLGHYSVGLTYLENPGHFRFDYHWPMGDDECCVCAVRRFTN